MGLIDDMDDAQAVRDAYIAKWGGDTPQDKMLDRSRRLLHQAAVAIRDLQDRVAVLEAQAGITPGTPPNPSP